MFKDWGGCVVNGAATLDCLPIVFSNLLNAVSAVAGVTALTMFIVAGIKFTSSSGDPKKLEGAKHNFSYGLLGLSVVLFSFLIIKIIARVTGVECITMFGFGC
jgi:glucose uptake protein GlcU